MKSPDRLIAIALLLTVKLLSSSLMAQNPPVPSPPVLDAPKETVLPALSALCLWDVDISDITIQDNTQMGPQNAGNAIFSSYGFAVASGRGMEIWASAYAQDELFLYEASCTANSGGDGIIKMSLIRRCANPQPSVSAIWKPKFSADTSMIDDDATATVGIAMNGRCNELGLTVGIGAVVERSTAAQPSQYGNDLIAIPGIAPPIVFDTGTGATSIHRSCSAAAIANIDSATCSFSGFIATKVRADGSPFDSATCGSSCTASKAGLDLDGVCLYCGAHSYVLYGWY